ncbi:MAG: hypothetical protein ACYDA6_06710, partial [Solirubrobacteraceae bacterium]
SLYLALSLGVFWFARRGRWAWVAVCGALAGATRPTGILLIVPAALLYLYGPREDRAPDLPRLEDSWKALAGSALVRSRRLWPAKDGGGDHPRTAAMRVRAAIVMNALRPRYRPRPDLLWIALMPAGLLLFMSYLALAGGRATTPFSAQSLWGRSLAGPFVGLWSGAVAAFDGVRQLMSGQTQHAYLAQATGNPLTNASHNVLLFCFAVAAVVATVGVLRSLPLAYSAYTVMALALPLSYPVSSEPLMSLPRFLLVLFPMSMWAGARLTGRPRARAALLFLSTVALVFFTGAFATWHWVS